MINFYITLLISITSLRIIHIFGSNFFDLFILNIIFFIFIRFYKTYSDFFYSSAVPFFYLDFIHNRSYLIYTITFILCSFYLIYIDKKRILSNKKSTMYLRSIILFNLLIILQLFLIDKS